MARKSEIRASAQAALELLAAASTDSDHQRAERRVQEALDHLANAAGNGPRQGRLQESSERNGLLALMGIGGDGLPLREARTVGDYQTGDAVKRTKKSENVGKKKKRNRVSKRGRATGDLTSGKGKPKAGQAGGILPRATAGVGDPMRAAESAGGLREATVYAAGFSNVNPSRGAGLLEQVIGDDQAALLREGRI